jgi:site-specific DNA recombinase
MNAAVYARKSTDQNVSEDAKSVARQVANARAYATRRGWTVNDAHVYTDDDISGAEFARRPGFVRLMAALKPSPPFQVLIVSEGSRLGRESIETSWSLKQLIAAGVRVFMYLDDREQTLESAMDKVMLSLRTYADEVEREAGRQRTYDALLRKARAGHVTGGRLFGYENVTVTTPDGRRSHVERRIIEAEADVIRRIFTLCAEGHGQTAIAKRLNDERAPSPRAQRGRPRAWAPSTIREALFRTAYHGEITWNRSRKRDPWGQVRQQDRRPEDWIAVPAPQLRIVSEELWAAAHARLDADRRAYLAATGGQTWGRPRRPLESKYLLTGLAKCGACSGSLYVKRRNWSSGTGRGRIGFYGCTNHHLRGSAICANSLEVPMALADRAVLDVIVRDVLTPDRVQRSIDRALELLQPGAGAALDAQLTARLAVVTLEIDRLVSAIAAAGNVPALAAAVKSRTVEQQALRRQLDAHRQPPVDIKALLARVEAKAKDWRGVLSRQTSEARMILRSLLAMPVVFTPHRSAGTRRYEFSLEVSLQGLLQSGWRPHRDSNPGFSLERAAS